ncbi:defensin-like protein 35 [Arabidopsis lyrata subsp. lyrata]|uniref:defensin-like protein 35 n=1 Tax=Arabidopsis lyrata subsp. lyrata TaxID=81972 RepID=UPI000A29AA7D|nr:defensin-like protein 35 [Arabidopsis lyrata subsp. lyrata]|eukprot:XP_020865912.1 defensin-like protein 35 [Arabidopsis lyrata subsp. lyrata]
MTSNKISFFLVLCLCVLLTAEFGEAKSMNPTGRRCPDPNGVDKKSVCYSYCKTQGFMGGSCQGHTGNYMCKCYEG